MNSVKHFNIQLLCAALILITATNTYSITSEKTVIVSFDKDATRALHQITKIKNRWGLWFGLIALGEAVYIANDKNPYGIATMVKDTMKKLLQENLLKKTDAIEITKDDKPAASSSTHTSTGDVFKE